MMCGVQVSEESSLIPNEETNDFSHARTFVIPHEESPLFAYAGKNGEPPRGGG